MRCCCHGKRRSGRRVDTAKTICGYHDWIRHFSVETFQAIRNAQHACTSTKNDAFDLSSNQRSFCNKRTVPRASRLATLYVQGIQTLLDGLHVHPVLESNPSLLTTIRFQKDLSCATHKFCGTHHSMCKRQHFRGLVLWVVSDFSRRSAATPRASLTSDAKKDTQDFFVV